MSKLTVSHLLVAATIVVAVPTAGSPATAAQSEECGHCHDMEDPFEEGDTVHQMTNDEPKEMECAGISSHGVHDCENGDGPGDWSHDTCIESHLVPIGCSGSSALVVWLMVNRVDSRAADELVRRFPKWVQYDAPTRRLRALNCAGGAIWGGTVPPPSVLGLPDVRGADLLRTAITDPFPRREGPRTTALANHGAVHLP